MESAFEQITRFLGRFEDEVQGRDAARPDPALRQRLDSFARGACSESERSELCELLTTRPELVGYLAESVKQMRGANGSTS